MATPGRIAGSSPLTPAEMNVLLGVASGKTAKEIAAMRGTSTRTVEYQIRAIRRKMDCHTVTHAVATAFRCGLLA